MKHKFWISLCLLFAFFISVKDGYIALWRDGEKEPTVFPYRVEMLPEADQRILEKGIYLSDESKLAQILEDYLS